MGARILSFGQTRPKIHPTAFIAETAVLIGDVTIGPGASVWYHCVLRGDLAPIHVGAGSNIQDNTVIHVNSERAGLAAQPTWIGGQVSVGHCCLLHACTIETGGFVGMGSTVLDGAVVQGEAMLGAGSLLPPNRTIPKGQIWVGQPARFCRETRDTDQQLFFSIAGHYAELAQAYLDQPPEETGPAS